MVERELTTLIKEDILSELKGEHDFKIGLGQNAGGDLYENEINKIILNSNKYKGIPREHKFEDVGAIYNGKRYHINIKAHDVSKSSSPNLNSVSNIKKFAFDNEADVIYIMVDYSTLDNYAFIEGITIGFMHHLDWDCLCVSNQGKGILQLSKKPKFIHQDRDEWFQELRNRVVSFHYSQIERIKNKYLKEWEL